MTEITMIPAIQFDKTQLSARERCLPCDVYPNQMTATLTVR